jgi:hypothetical protein
VPGQREDVTPSRLCNAHIDFNDYAYTNTDDLWVCRGCFENHANPKNLSFVRELWP